MKYSKYVMSDGFEIAYDPKTLLPVKPKRIPFKVKAIAFGLVFMVISSTISPSNLHILYTPEYVPEFTETNLLDSLKSAGVYFPELVFRQMKHETGNFKSKLFLECNNLMGMTYPSSRKTTASGYRLGFDPATNKTYKYCVYSNWVDAVYDYKLYQQTNFNEKYYLSFLRNSGYAEDQNYISKINK